MKTLAVIIVGLALSSCAGKMLTPEEVAAWRQEILEAAKDTKDTWDYIKDDK